ncbi:MAG: iron-sulfur cluster assembly protein [Candidatus Bathyarchaeia archaeon]
MDKEEVLEALKKVYDPEHPISVIDLKIVEPDDVTFEGDRVKVTFKPTTPYCPMGGVIGIIIKYALEKRFKREFDVSVKAGTHVQEAMLNEVLSDRKKYGEMLKRMEDSGLLKSCVAL